MNNHLKNTIMKKLFIVLTLFSAVALSDGYAQTNLKIGYTNVDYVLNLLPEAKEIEAELSAYGKQLESQLQSKMAEFQEKLNDYQTKMSNGEMLPAVARDKENELNALRSSIEKFQRDADASLQKKQVDLLQPAYEKIQNAINVVAEANSYTHVLSSDVGAFAVLLYANEDSNITDLVLAELGIEAPVEAANE
jgi:outer membrane protein